MAKYIIDRLEPVQIHTNQAETFMRSRRERDGRDDTIIEGGAIRQIGQRIVLSHMLDALLMPLPFGQIIDDTYKILRFSVRGLHRQPGRGNNSRPIARRKNCVFVKKRRLSGSNQFTIFDFNCFSAGFWHDFSGGLAEHIGAVDAKIFLGCSVDQQVLQVRDALHDNWRWHILDDCIEE
ncbi:MAG: hypothetical protein WBG10_15075 [Pseudolabrys sp.]